MLLALLACLVISVASSAWRGLVTSTTSHMMDLFVNARNIQQMEMLEPSLSQVFKLVAVTYHPVGGRKERIELEETLMLIWQK